MRTGNRQLMRELNRNLVLDLIRRGDGISQAEICSRTQLSSGTVTNIVKELRGGRFVREIGRGEAVVGRRPTLLRFNAEAGYVLSAAFFADETCLGVLDLAGGIRAQTTFATRPERGPRKVFEEFGGRVNRLVADAGVHRNRFLGAGVAFEGIVDPGKGTLILGTRFGWRNVPIKDHVERELRVRTFVESDGGAMVLGEYRYGVGQGVGDLVCIDIDAGIGAIAISPDRICRGAHHMAGEIGHTRMVPDGPSCRCGKRGCLEVVASGGAILRRVREGLKEERPSTISEAVHSNSTREAIRAVFEAARSGDAFTGQVIREAGYYLGLATAAVINYADPELVILTGCVTYESGGMILDLIRKTVQEEVMDSKFRTIRVEEGVLGERAPLIGAATLVYDDAFKIPPVNA